MASSKNDDGTARSFRELPALVRFDPYARTAKKLASQDQYSTWQFFETPDCIMISDDISGKIAHNAIHRVEFFYLGRPTNTTKPTVVKFSFYQGGKIASFLGMVLDEYAEMQAKTREQGLEGMPTIPYLRGKEGRNYTSRDEKRYEYWTQHSDLDLDNVRLSVLLNKTLGQPEVMINSPVPVETSNKMKGWPGPVLTLSMNACANLEAFIKENRKENIDSFITVRPREVVGVSSAAATDVKKGQDNYSG